MKEQEDTEEKCWSLGRGRLPPYFQKSRKLLSKGKDRQSAHSKNYSAGKTITVLTALFVQGLHPLISLSSPVAMI